MSTLDATATSPHTTQLRDLRSFWRVTLAIIAPLPMLALAVGTALNPASPGAEFLTTVSDTAAEQARAGAVQWFGAAFVIGIVPAIIAVALVTRRRTPRLTTLGLLLAGTGFLAGISSLPDEGVLALLTVQERQDPAVIDAIVGAYWETTLVGIATGLFLLGLMLGLSLLGIALWRSKAAPTWMGLALAVGAFTHPFIPTNTAVAAGLLVASIGFAGASRALLTTSNDDFDLPPLPQRSGQKRTR